MTTTAQFIYDMVALGPEALDGASSLFRAADDEIIKDAIAACDLINNVANGVVAGSNPARGLKKFIKSDPIAREWAWFKRILVDMFLIIILSIGTLLALYFLG